MNKKIHKIFLIITLIFGSLLLVSIRDVLAAPPVVTGVEDGVYYKVPVTISFDEAEGTVTATLNTVSISSGHNVIVDGSYVLFVTDGVESTTINFWIDTIAPQVTGVTDGSTVNTSVTPIISDVSPYNATLNGSVYISNTPISAEDDYELIVTDLANNVTTINFTIDTTPPLVTGVEDGEYYNTSVSASFTDATATLNGSEYISGTPIEAEDEYELVVTDLANNVTTINFVIDTTPPVITIGTYTLTPTNQDITVNASVVGGTLNATSHTFTANGSFIFTATDLAGNQSQTTVTITNIDKDAPIVTGVADGEYYNTTVSAVFTNATATLNGSEYTSGTPISAEDEYELIVTDLANNVTTINFVIDTTPPVVTGVEDGEYYNTTISAVFTNATATLNGSVYTSGTLISVEDDYELIVTDLANNVTTINFVIDTTPPVITIGTYTLTPTNQDITVNASVVGGTLNATSHTFTTNGSFTFIATDLAGNQSQTIVTITNIDKEAPVVTGVADGEYYNTTVSAVFTNATATLNGSEYTSGTPISAEDEYELIVTDLANNVTTINFSIDTTPPVVTGVVDGEYYNTTVSAVFTNATATLNGSEYISGTPIEAEDEYELIVTDLANNVTTINFVIDTTPPVITIGTYTLTPTNQDITVNASVVGGTLNATSHTFTTNGSFTFIATDLAGNQSQTIVTITNIDKEAPAVTGVADGEYYNTTVSAVFTNATATLNGDVYLSGTPIEAEDEYELVVTDLANNVTTINFIIDTTAPVVTGVEDNAYYNTSVSASFADATATLNGSVYTSGTLISAEDDYELIVTDLANNVTTINFVIDKTPPVVIGVTNNSYYNNDRIITFNEGSATLNSVTFNTGNTVSLDGIYTLVVTDLAGNITTVNFVIDRTAPAVTGVENGMYYNTDRIITFEEGTATLNGDPFTSGDTVSSEGSYELIVTSLAGNITTINFVIDKTDPVVTGVTNNSYYNNNRVITFNEGSATLNSTFFASGTTVSIENMYTLIVTDLAGNITTVNFVIDKTAPFVTGVMDGEYYNTTVSAVFANATATLNGDVYLPGTPISAEDEYELVVTDLANNVTTINFVIDKTPPVITIGTYTLTPTNLDITVNASVVGGTLNATSHTFTANGSFTFTATDLAGNQSQTIVTITNIDKVHPVINGVVDGTHYNTDRSPTFNEGTALLNGSPYISGTLINAEDDYVLVVTDPAGNVTSVSFTIDKTPPAVIGVEDEVYYNSNRLITFNEGSATLNSNAFTSGQTVSIDGNYTLIVTDLAGNITTISFVLDKTLPIITIAPYNLDPTNDDIIVYASTNEGSLNATSYTFTENGSFTFIATDLAGNISQRVITITNIDKDAPAVIGVSNNAFYNIDRTITFNKGTATLNGVPILSGAIVTDEDDYILIVTDDAGNTTTVNFVIDKTAPVILGVLNNSYYNTNRTITFNEGSATLNSISFNSGTIISDEGNYTLIVTDLAGNVTTVSFVIDKSVPIVSGIANNNYYNTNRTITFNEGSATLNGSAFTSGTIVSSENTYTLVVTDLAGNVTIVNFVIDKSVPIVSGIANNNYYNTNRTITFNEGSATLNGTAFTSGTIVSTENTYILVVTDLAGNVTTVNFVLDKTAPVITLAPYESTLAVSSVTVSATVNEGSLNASSRVFTANGSYTFIATDLAGNVTQRIVTITNIGYTLNYSLVGTGGDLIAMVNSIMVNSGSLVIESRSIMFTATPATRYRVYAWRLDGNVVGDRSNTYLLNMLNRGMNVTVEFVLEGDLNNSNSVSITDLVILRRHLAGLEAINDKAKEAADINASGGISITDLVILRRRLAGLE